MLDSLGELGLAPATLLDIGAVIGVLHHELLGRGVESALHLEAAAAYVEAAQEEAMRRGYGPRIRFLHGDFVDLALVLPVADLVTLDRVVCCYPDLESLVQRSAEKARRYFALSFPHDRWYVRGYTWWQNDRRRRAGNSFRTFIHAVTQIRAGLGVGGRVRHSGLPPDGMMEP